MKPKQPNGLAFLKKQTVHTVKICTFVDKSKHLKDKYKRPTWQVRHLFLFLFPQAKLTFPPFFHFFFKAFKEWQTGKTPLNEKLPDKVPTCQWFHREIVKVVSRFQVPWKPTHWLKVSLFYSSRSGARTYIHTNNVGWGPVRESFLMLSMSCS